jgi:hypothetical protein
VRGGFSPEAAPAILVAKLGDGGTMRGPVLAGLVGTLLAASPAVCAAAQARPAEVPDLSFVPTAAIERGYDKFFVYHREATDFATAYADLKECDAYARGISLHVAPPGALAALVVDAIVGAAQRHDISRRNMRTCMRFKEYRRYGLPEALWKRIGFDPASGSPDQAKRVLRLQARIASGPRPPEADLGL